MRRREARRDEGSALIVTTLVLFMLMMLVMTLAGTNVARSEASLHARRRIQLLAAAEAGIGFKLNEVLAAEADPSSFGLRTYTVEGITVEVFAEEVGEATLRLQARASHAGGMRRVVEGYVSTALHPLFHKAVYAGNKDQVSGYRLRLGPADQPIKSASRDDTATEDFADATRINQGIEDDYTTVGDKQSGVKVHGDYVEGDVFVNGDAEVRGTTNIYGDVDVTGSAVGRPVSWTDPTTGEGKVGVTTQGAANVAPPDLRAMDYPSLAQGPGAWVVQANDPASKTERHPTEVEFIHRGTFMADDETYFNEHADEFDRPNFQFGAPNMTDRDSTYYTIEMSKITGAGDQIIYVKGNLWLETDNGAGFKLPASPDGKKVTIVVEGNLYISDELSYADPEKDAFLFIVKGAEEQGWGESESFVDGYDAQGKFDPALLNGVYDPGEKIINDNENGVYDGPREGQGNIYFGDRTQTWGGITDGYLYAENNGYLVTSNTKAQVFGVRGFFSAGGILDMGSAGADVNRAVGRDEDFTAYRVKFDPRLMNGTITLKGAPSRGGGFAGLAVFAWRELAPGEWSAPAH